MINLSRNSTAVRIKTEAQANALRAIGGEADEFIFTTPTGPYKEWIGGIGKLTVEQVKEGLEAAGFEVTIY